jgi:hypothetical protein
MLLVFPWAKPDLFLRERLMTLRDGSINYA